MADITAAKYVTGVERGWHAIDGDTPQGCDLHSHALCGELVRLAKDDLQPYNPDSYPVKWDPCSTCAWTVAAATGTLDAALARLADPVAHDAAAGFLNARLREYQGADDPALIQLLAAVTDHAPVHLVSEACSEGDCDHEGDCPATVACHACSLQAGRWAGEWEGTYRDECTIPAPCAVLLALAEAAKQAVAEASAGAVTVA